MAVALSIALTDCECEVTTEQLFQCKIQQAGVAFQQITFQLLFLRLAIDLFRRAGVDMLDKKREDVLQINVRVD